MKKLGLALVLVGLLLSMGVPAAQAAPQEASFLIHVVKPGENLFRIALRYGTSVSAIAAANGIRNPNLIYAGQRLIIPSRHFRVPCVQTRYVVRRGDTLYRIALRFGVSVQSIVQANGIVNRNRIYAGQRLIIPCARVRPPSHGFFYTVRRGDTLAGIAFRFGVNLYHLARVNGIVNVNLIYAGQVLRIP